MGHVCAAYAIECLDFMCYNTPCLERDTGSNEWKSVTHLLAQKRRQSRQVNTYCMNNNLKTKSRRKISLLMEEIDVGIIPFLLELAVAYFAIRYVVRKFKEKSNIARNAELSIMNQEISEITQKGFVVSNSYPIRGRQELLIDNTNNQWYITGRNDKFHKFADIIDAIINKSTETRDGYSHVIRLEVSVTLRDPSSPVYNIIFIDRYKYNTVAEEALADDILSVFRYMISTNR